MPRSPDIYELYRLLTGNSEHDIRDRLLHKLQHLGAAGALLFRVDTKGELPKVVILWDHDFSNELGQHTPGQVLTNVISNAPAWAVRWLADRQKVFWLQRYIHYIPFATRLILKLTAVQDAKPLADLLMVSFKGKYHYKLMSGWHKPLDKAQTNQVSLLLTAYLRSTDFSELEKNMAAYSLTETQLACFRWMAAGKSQQEIAAILGMSYANVRYHMEKAKKDSGYSTMQQVLVDVARRYDLSPMGPERQER